MNKALLPLVLLLVPLALPAATANHWECGAPTRTIGSVSVWDPRSACAGASVRVPGTTCPGYIYHDEGILLSLCVIGVWLS